LQSLSFNLVWPYIFPGQTSRSMLRRGSVRPVCREILGVISCAAKNSKIPPCISLAQPLFSCRGTTIISAVRSCNLVQLEPAACFVADRSSATLKQPLATAEHIQKSPLCTKWNSRTTDMYVRDEPGVDIVGKAYHPCIEHGAFLEECVGSFGT
jgi:hypothetical protein